MDDSEVKPSGDVRARPVAGLWNTLLVVGIMGGVAALSAAGSGDPQAGADAMKTLPPQTQSLMRLVSYGLTIGYQWIVILIIWIGLRLRKNKLVELGGEPGRRKTPFLADLGLAVVFAVAANVVLYGVMTAMKVPQSQAVVELMPHDALETAAFLLVAMTAGICEEIIFRGYLQRQIAGWTGSTGVAVVVQAVLFGLAHLYQGWTMVPVLAVYGAMFGLLAWWRRSLRPGILAHVLHDGVVGLVFALAMK